MVTGERRPFEHTGARPLWETMGSNVACSLPRPLARKRRPSPYNGVHMPFFFAGVLVVKTLACLDPEFSTKMAPVLTPRATLFKRHLFPSGPVKNTQKPQDDAKTAPGTRRKRHLFRLHQRKEHQDERFEILLPRCKIVVSCESEVHPPRHYDPLL